jgi:polysaccharide biosynthesis protein PslJ
LLSRLVTFSAVIAAVGVVQYYLRFNLVDYLIVPGLSENTEMISVAERSGILRVAGTAAHPIEFGVVMAVSLPLALHRLLYAPRRFARHWLVLFLLALAASLSGSRSAILAMCVALVVLFAGWDWRRRRLALLLAPLVALAVRAVAPGVLGTILSLFRNHSRDSSVTGRTDDYAEVGAHFWHSPFFGRGAATWVPDLHIVLDNQYLVQLLETGALGLAAFTILLLTGWCLARGGRRLSRDEAGRHLGQTLAAAVAAAAVSAGTFDSLSFPMYAGLIFLLLGCCGAWWRIARDEANDEVAAAERQQPSTA